MTSPGNTRLDEENHVTSLQLINARPKEQSPLLALNEKIQSYLQCNPDAAVCAIASLAKAMALANYQRDEKDRCLDIAVTDGFRALSRVLGPRPARDADNDSWKTLTTFLIAFLACSDDAETMRRVALEQVQDGGKIERRLERVRETPPASFSSAFRKAKAAALEAGQTTVMEVTLYDFHSLEPPNPNVEGSCGENSNEEEEEEEEVKEEVENEYAPGKHHLSLSHLFHVGIGPEGGMIWQGRWLTEYGIDGYAYSGDRLRS